MILPFALYFSSPSLDILSVVHHNSSRVNIHLNLLYIMNKLSTDGLLFCFVLVLEVNQQKNVGSSFKQGSNVYLGSGFEHLIFILKTVLADG